MLVSASHEAEHRNGATCGGAISLGHAVAGLLGQHAEVDAAPVDARRGAGFQTPLRQLELFQTAGQAHRRWIAGAPRRVVLQADVDFAVQESTGCEHHGFAIEAYAHLRDHASHSVTFNGQVVAGALEQPQILLIFQPLANGRAVQNPVGLRSSGAHGRAFGAVEDAKLDARFVGGRRHRATHGVDLFDEMAFADAANRRVAAHLAERFDVVRQQQGSTSHARGSQRGLGSGMTATDHNHVKLFWKKHRGRHARPKF